MSRLLKKRAAIDYSANVSTTRWGDAITRLLAERGWTRRQLAEAASVRPNTLTNIIKHGRDADLATLSRLAEALKVDIAELFLTREQSVVLYAHRQTNIDRLRDLVVRELSATVTTLVERELERIEQAGGAVEANPKSREYRVSRRASQGRKTPSRKR